MMRNYRGITVDIFGTFFKIAIPLKMLKVIPTVCFKMPRVTFILPIVMFYKIDNSNFNFVPINSRIALQSFSVNVGFILALCGIVIVFP